jgi:hypothetical protein
MDDPILSDPPSFNLSLKKLALIVDPFSAESTLNAQRNRLMGSFKFLTQ